MNILTTFCISFCLWATFSLVSSRSSARYKKGAIAFGSSSSNSHGSWETNGEVRRRRFTREVEDLEDNNARDPRNVDDDDDGNPPPPLSSEILAEKKPQGRSMGGSNKKGKFSGSKNNIDDDWIPPIRDSSSEESFEGRSMGGGGGTEDDNDDGNPPPPDSLNDEHKGRAMGTVVIGLDGAVPMSTAIQGVNWHGVSLLSDDVIEGDIKYWFFTKKNPITGEKFNSTNKKDDEVMGNWNKEKECIIIIHGWMDNPNMIITSSSLKIKNAYIEKDESDDNIIIVDWSKFSEAANYTDTAKMVSKVANVIADFIKYLVDEKLIKNYSKIHLVGVNVGAHLAGIIGTKIQKKEKKKIGWITGLDPTWEIFDDDEEDKRLTKDDAEFVDILHCNMGNEAGKLGTEKRIGTADFYPNGGVHQPGCGSEIIGICSSNECQNIYIKTIKGTKYKACKCEDWKEFEEDKCSCKDSALLGDPVPKTAKGKYYLSTRIKKDT